MTSQSGQHQPPKTSATNQPTNLWQNNQWAWAMDGSWITFRVRNVVL